MALDSRLRELDTRHREMDAAIQLELSHPAADPVRITEMKRQKLKLKEEIEEIRGRLRH
jgi:hypothetical protein